MVRKKILYVYITNDFHLTCNMLLHYLVKVDVLLETDS